MTGVRERTGWMLRLVVPPAAVAFAVSVLLFFPPAQYGFYPRCPFHELFNLQCPGCGATRALAALLRGHLGEALRLNALTVLLSPFMASYGVICYRRLLRGEVMRLPQPRPVRIYATLVIAIVFTVVRNLPRHF